MSRIVSGKLQIHVDAIDLAQVARLAVEAVQPQVDAKQIALTVDIRQAPIVVAGDAHRLQQIVQNLMSNAVKFTPDGGRVRLRSGRQAMTRELRWKTAVAGSSRPSCRTCSSGSGRRTRGTRASTAGWDWVSRSCATLWRRTAAWWPPQRWIQPWQHLYGHAAAPRGGRGRRE